MAAFHNVVSLAGYTVEDTVITMKISGATAANVGGPLSIDTAAPNTLKPAADNDRIVAYLVAYEARSAAQGGPVGSVAFRFVQKFPLKAADTAVVGDTVVAGGAGTVKKAPANSTDNFIAELTGGVATVVRL